MKRSVLLLFSICLSIIGLSSELYSKAFGEKKNAAIIYLHGGPGYNCSTFEYSSAEKLSKQGFYVIVYDRRGEGRSIDEDAKFTYKEALKDLVSIYKKYDIETATLIGHSFGGIIASKFADKQSKKVKNVILVGTPLNFQESFKTIISSCKKIYETKEDETNLKYIEMLEKMDTTKLEYAVFCFAHAMQNGFYSTSNPFDESKEIYSKLGSNPEAKKWASTMTQEPTRGFWQNESYTTEDIRPILKNLMSKNINVYGLYGKEDGLFSNSQISNLQDIIGRQNVVYLEDCSHSVYIDQQKVFISTIKNWLSIK